MTRRATRRPIDEERRAGVRASLDDIRTAMDALGLGRPRPDDGAANILGVSPETVARWREGKGPTAKGAAYALAILARVARMSLGRMPGIPRQQEDARNILRALVQNAHMGMGYLGALEHAVAFSDSGWLVPNLSEWKA